MAAVNADAYLWRLLDLLSPLGEPRRAAAAQRDKGSRYTFLAIRVPALRRVATRDLGLDALSVPQRLAVLDYIWRHTDIYEAMSVPLLYYRSIGRRIENSAFPTLRRWISRIDNWGHCDDLAVIYSYCNHNQPARVMPFLRRLNASADIWRIRTSLVALLHYAGKHSVYLEPNVVLPMLDPHLSHPDPYVANAVGWVLREMRRRYRRDLDDYLATRGHLLSNVACRKAGLR